MKALKKHQNAVAQKKPTNANSGLSSNGAAKKLNNTNVLSSNRTSSFNLAFNAYYQMYADLID